MDEMIPEYLRRAVRQWDQSKKSHAERCAEKKTEHRSIWSERRGFADPAWPDDEEQEQAEARIEKIVNLIVRKRQMSPSEIDHEERIRQLEAQVSELRSMVIPPSPRVGTFEQWITSPEMQKFGGKFIAYERVGEVVAFSDSDDALMDSLADFPNKNRLIIDRVPSAKR